LTEFTILPAVEAVLTTTFQRPIHISHTEQISEEERRNVLLRCTLAEADGHIPTTVIVKQVRAEHYAPDDVENNWDTQRFYLGWAGLALLQQLSPQGNYVPYFYGGSGRDGFIVQEDLGGEHRSLVEPLLEGDAVSAERALLQTVDCLAQMHGESLGQTAVAQQIAQQIHPDFSLIPSAAQRQTWSEGVIKHISAVLEPEPNFYNETQQVYAANFDPSPFYGYIHSDPCPDNYFHTSKRMMLIDFEFGRLGNVLIDVVYGRMTFPSCWCANRLPANLITRLENSYRQQLAQQHPAAQDHALFTTALVDACALWLLMTLDWQLREALANNGKWGLATFQPRVLARLQAFLEVADGRYPALRTTASRLLDHLTTQWSDVEPLPLYPAFR
jgi:Ser/Thr protein kinase RdoA (MazF antagonist)